MNQSERPLRILIAEDDALIAMDLADTLEALGYAVVGPVASVAAALAQAEDIASPLDGALLDLDLRGELSHPVANALDRRGVPFAFTSGYAAEMIDPAFQAHPCLLKPIEQAMLVSVLKAFGSGERAAAG